jgi:hypothetical protein
MLYDTSDTVKDYSGNGGHFLIPPAWSKVYRELLKGDHLYASKDTWQITTISHSTKVISVTRGHFSGLGAEGIHPYYQTVSNNTYSVKVYEGFPGEYANRLVSYWEDDELKYVGTLTDLNSDGPKWVISTSNLLKAFKAGFKFPELTLKPAFAWVLKGGYLPIEYNNVPPMYLNLSAETNYIGLGDIVSNAIEAVSYAYDFNNAQGFTYDGSSAPTDSTDVKTQATRDCFCDGDSWIKGAGHQYITSEKGIKQYGILFADGIIVTLESLQTYFLNHWIEIREGIYALVSYVSAIPGTNQVTFKGPYDKEFNHVPGVTVGTVSDTAIELPIKPVIRGLSLGKTIQQLLCSVGDIATYEIPAFMALGLPESLVSQEVLNACNDFTVATILEGAIDSDLQAFSLFLAFQDGRITLKKMPLPIAAMASRVITDTELKYGTRPKVAWGYHKPVSKIIFENAAEKISITLNCDSWADHSNMRTKEWKTALGAKLQNRQAFIAQQIKRLQWFNSYVPTVTCEIPNHGLSIGEVVLVTFDSLAGQGRYGIKNIPALVTKLEGDESVQFCLNASATLNNALWCPSWHVASNVGATCTLQNAEGLSLTLLSGYIGMEVMCISYDGTFEEYNTIASVTDANTIVLDSAPTWDLTKYQVIITMGLWGDALVSAAHKSAFVWASDATGAMSDAAEGKKLL